MLKMKFPKLSGKAVLAPMAGVTDVAFRVLARHYGAALAYTEFVSSIAVARENEKTLKMLKTDKSEKPSAVQVFGSTPEEILSAAKILEKKFDIIDINCGCPAVKLTKLGAGSWLMKDPKKIGEIVRMVSSEIKKPVTIKIRAGFGKNRNAVEAARIAEEAGAAAVAVHGRAFTENYIKKADWSIIKEVKDAVSIPVIGNGDIASPETAKQRLEESNVDYIMVGRAAMSNPYIFSQINEFLAKGEYSKKPGSEQFEEYLKAAEKMNVDFSMIKAHSIMFTKGAVGGASLRDRLSRCKDINQLSAELEKK